MSDFNHAWSPLPGDDEEAISLTSNFSTDSTRVATTPLPKAQLSSLFVVRIADPIAYQQIFPYINQLLVGLRVAEPDQVGFYSGLVEGAYALAQVLSVYQWGRLSDVVGRRPVVFAGLIGMAVATTSFGLSTSFVSIVVFRFFGGLFAGNVAVVQSIISEITDDTNQDLAVSIFSLSPPMGAIIGPLIGGVLVNAGTRYPQYFSWSVFLERPYLLPCMASAACALFGAVLGYVFIEEVWFQRTWRVPTLITCLWYSKTLPSKRKDADARTNVSFGSSGDPDVAEPTSAMELLSIPEIRSLTLSGFALSFLSVAFDVVLVLFCYTSVDAGGLGLGDPAILGNVLAFAGMLALLLRLFAMPYILRRFDYANAYNACMYIWPVAFGALPCLNLLARARLPSSSGSDPVPMSAPDTISILVWTGLLILLALSKIGMIPLTLSILLVKRHAPSPGTLGRSNGLVQLSMCAGRAVGPVVVSALFVGVNGMEWVRQRALGWMWAVGMVIGGVVGARVTEGMRSEMRRSSH